MEWLGLDLYAIIDYRDPVARYALSCRVKYCRLVRRKINGRNRFYVQLVCEGKPHVKAKNHFGTGNVGLDIGPSTIAAAGERQATLQLFCNDLVGKERIIRILQRKMDRQRRANNPDNYNPDGTFTKGPKKWIKSNRYNVRNRVRRCRLPQRGGSKTYRRANMLSIIYTHERLVGAGLVYTERTIRDAVSDQAMSDRDFLSVIKGRRAKHKAWKQKAKANDAKYWTKRKEACDRAKERSESSRVGNAERLAGKLHEPFIEGPALKGVGLLYQFCNAAGALCATKRGAIPALPDREEVHFCIKNSALLT